MNILVIDTETTGLDHEKDKVVEIGACLVGHKEVKRAPWSIINLFTSLVDPGVPIPPDAMAIHHIRDEEVKGSLKLDKVLEALYFSGKFIPAAHNAAFDSLFLPYWKDWICTYRCARHIWPDFPKHGNQVLRYRLNLLKEPDPLAMPPHRAAPDAYVTAHLLLRMLETHTPEQLLELTKKPILIKNCSFGKHRGLEWSKVPKDYLGWILKQKPEDWDADTIHTAKYWADHR